MRALRYLGDVGLESHGRLSALPDAELARLVDGLDRTVRPCGCKEGAVGVSVAFVLWPLWVGLNRRPSTVMGWTIRVVQLVPVTVIGALTFKGAGIALGRAQHRRLRMALAVAAAKRDGAGPIPD